MSEWSSDEIEVIAQSVRPLSWESYRNCGPINREIASEFDKQGIPCEVVEGMVAPYGRRGLGPEHAWVKVPADAVEGVSSDVIVDGALDQFSMENKEAGIVQLELESEIGREIENIEVLTRGDDLYSVYTP